MTVADHRLPSHSAPPHPTVVHMVASCRRERIIERATRQRIEKRTASRKAASDAAAAAAAENSRWRQTYSDRMAVRLSEAGAGWEGGERGERQESGQDWTAVLCWRVHCSGFPAQERTRHDCRVPWCSVAALLLVASLFPAQPLTLTLPQESMRRADEALGRQAGQAHGPSFVEAQEREFARQASVQLSSKKSCKLGNGRGGAERARAGVQAVLHIPCGVAECI